MKKEKIVIDIEKDWIKAYELVIEFALSKGSVFQHEDWEVFRANQGGETHTEPLFGTITSTDLREQFEFEGKVNFTENSNFDPRDFSLIDSRCRLEMRFHNIADLEKYRRRDAKRVVEREALSKEIKKRNKANLR